MTEEKPKKLIISVPNRLLRALQSIYENQEATIDERLQAIKLSVEVLPMRPKVKRKTDKDKAVIAALQGGSPKPSKPVGNPNFRAQKKGEPQEQPSQE